MLPRGTEPKLMEAGATVNAAPLDVVGESEELFGAPVTPTHPEVERITSSRRAVAAAEIVFLPK